MLFGSRHCYKSQGVKKSYPVKGTFHFSHNFQNSVHNHLSFVYNSALFLNTKHFAFKLTNWTLASSANIWERDCRLLHYTLFSENLVKLNYEGCL